MKNISKLQLAMTILSHSKFTFFRNERVYVTCFGSYFKNAIELTNSENFEYIVSRVLGEKRVLKTYEKSLRKSEAIRDKQEQEEEENSYTSCDWSDYAY